MVAIVVILAATISVFALGFTEDANQPGPIVGQSSGELVPQDGNDDGIIRVNHVAGDTIQVSNMEVVVDASDACGKQGRLVDLPVPSSGNDIDATNIEGDDIFDESFGGLPDDSVLDSQEYCSIENGRQRRDYSVTV